MPVLMTSWSVFLTFPAYLAYLGWGIKSSSSDIYIRMYVFIHMCRHCRCHSSLLSDHICFSYSNSCIIYFTPTPYAVVIISFALKNKTKKKERKKNVWRCHIQHARRLGVRNEQFLLNQRFLVRNFDSSIVSYLETFSIMPVLHTRALRELPKRLL